MLQRAYVGDAAFGKLRELFILADVERLQPFLDGFLGGKVEREHFLYLFRRKIDVVHFLFLRHEVRMTEIVAFCQFVFIGRLCHGANICHIRVDGVGHQSALFPVTYKAVACFHCHVVQSEFAAHFFLVVADLVQDDAQPFDVGRSNFHGTAFLGTPTRFQILYIRGKEILEQHLALGLYFHDLHHAVQHVVFHALDDRLRLFRIEVVRLERRLYPCEDLGELPVLYPDARHEGGRGVLQGAVFFPFKLLDGEACHGFHVGLVGTHTGIDRAEVFLSCL